MKRIIDAKGLTKVFRRGREEIHALKNVDFQVGEGEFVTIIGPSGSGKTALLNTIGCLDTPTGGSLLLNGREVIGLKERDLVKLRRENIGFVFQQFYLMPTLTARENIELPLLFSHKDDSGQKVDEILRIVGLADRGDHLPGQLSGGEMQRVAIGRALINDPRIILADEPTGNLDSATSKVIFDLFGELNRRGLTLVIVTHNMDLARVAHRMYTLRDGKIVTCETFAEDPNNRGGALYGPGKYNEAHNEAIGQDPNPAEVWNNKGNAHYYQGKYDEAIKAYDEAIRLDPNYASAWYNKGGALYGQSMYDEAARAYDEAIRQDPKLAEAWNNKGNARYGQGKYEDAIKAYDEAIRLDPNYASAWNNKGNARYGQGKYDEAIKAYDEAIRLDPNLVETWNNKGVSLEALGRTTESNAVFAKARELRQKG